MVESVLGRRSLARIVEYHNNINEQMVWVGSLNLVQDWAGFFGGLPKFLVNNFDNLPFRPSFVENTNQKYLVGYVSGVWRSPDS